MVHIENDVQLAFLPTQAMLRKGDKVSAQYVCLHKGRILLSARFANTIVKQLSLVEKAEELLDENCIRVFPVDRH